MQTRPEAEKSLALLKLAHGLMEHALTHEDPAEFWPRLAQKLIDAFTCERVTIFQRIAKDELISVYAHGLKSPLRVKRGEGLAGVVAETHQSLISNDPYKDPRFHLDADRITGFRTQNILATPLIYNGRALGVIELMNKDGGFDKDDLEAVRYLASEIAVIFLKFSLEAQQKDMTTQLIQVEKMAAVGRMAAGVAHEINNPVTAILVVTHRLLKLAAGRPDVLEGLLKADAAARRIQVFVQNLLGFSRAAPPSHSRHRLDHIIDNSLQLISHELDNRKVEIIKKFDPGAPPVVGDGTALKQVFINLMVNALQAMDDQGGGKLTLRVFGSRENDKDGAVAEVSDTGPGMPAEIREKIFEPFFTTKPEGVGTGLGLYIINGILERHRARIAVDNAPEHGAVFRVTFPKPD